MREATKQTTLPRGRQRKVAASARKTIGTAVSTQQPGEFIGARCAIEVEVNEPIDATTQRIVHGRLRGEQRIGAHLVYYKIILGDGTVYLAKPEWMSPASLADIELGRQFSSEKWRKAEYHGTIYALTDILDRRDAARLRSGGRAAR